MPEVLEQSVTYVDHRRRAARGGQAGRVRRLRAQVRPHQLIEVTTGRGVARAQQRQASRRAAHGPGQGDHVSWPGARPRDRRGAGQFASRRDRDHDPVGPGNVAAGD